MIPRFARAPLLLGIAVLSLAGCAVDNGGYGYGYNGDVAFDGGYYGPYGYDYGGWGQDYYVGPYRDGYGHDHGGHDRGPHDGGGHDNNGGNGPHAYRPPAGGHGTPSIPSHARSGGGGGGGAHGGGGHAH